MMHQPDAELATDRLETHIGILGLVANEEGLLAIFLPGDKPADAPQSSGTRAATHLDAAKEALSDYFAGKRSDFADVTLAPQGTDFQKRVWQELARIPYGATRSYAQIAQGIGNPKAVRAVGLANGRNPLPIIVPCHRVIGSNGTLTGFRGGLAMKKALLDLEGAATPNLI